MPLAHCKVLIIGGYGAFGGRLARLLADDARISIVIAGRSIERARNFVHTIRQPNRISPVRLDRNGELDKAFGEIGADIVVDASGPFQAYGDNPYRVAKAAIRAGSSYIDLADSREFVSAIVDLDELATENGVFAISGASTCPALTGAVARNITAGFTRVDSIYGGISPSPHAAIGRSVVAAVADYAGKPVPVRIRGRIDRRRALLDSRRFTIAPPGCRPLAPLTFSLLDVPDVELLADIDIPVASTWFGFAAVPRAWHWLLRLFAALVRIGLVRSLRPLSGIMHAFRYRFSWGEHRGGLFVTARGRTADETQIDRSWHLVGEGDDGPMVPTFAAAALIRRHVEHGGIPPGARPAHRELELEDFDTFFNRFAIGTGIRESSTSEYRPVFTEILGDASVALPPAVRDLHRARAASRFVGIARVERGKSIVATAIAGLIGFPAPGSDVPVTVRIDADERGESWHRTFGTQCFSSRITVGHGGFDRLLVERFGAVRIGMALVVRQNRLHYVPERWSLWQIPMPRWLMPRGEIYEFEDEHGFNFHVDVVMPLAGRIVCYRGSLVRDVQGTTVRREAPPPPRGARA